MNIPSILMNSPREPKVEVATDDDDMPPPLRETSIPPRPASGPWFTLDDVPPRKWRSKILKFNVWLDLQMVDPRLNLKVLTEFTSKFTGSIREWFFSLSEYSQKTIPRSR
ncbi:hypothetical protein JCGZ_19414 [Jatropha curcas]|uniref:Uncharacterized protein n=1 Tax=Jatropha curcas TaxID=180498 RepID=A0A067KBX5_JATCU|nr:hypothetical protein JCGZ_19414 [Jatropha curcas]